MKLENPTPEFVRSTLTRYEKDGGHLLNEKLLKLFKTFNDQNNLSETRIKVAALNTLYSTAIKNINPVVDKILSVCEKVIPNSIEDYVNFTDGISLVEWTNTNTGKSYKRNNISFASKYVHFLSDKTIPIYDSYIWIIVKGYLGQNGISKMSFANPKTYKEFYEIFSLFKSEFNLDEFSNYELDKFLWQFGRESIGFIESELNFNLGKAKAELRRRIKNY